MGIHYKKTTTKTKKKPKTNKKNHTKQKIVFVYEPIRTSCGMHDKHPMRCQQNEQNTPRLPIKRQQIFLLFFNLSVNKCKLTT